MKQTFFNRLKKMNKKHLALIVISGAFTVIFYYIQYSISQRENYAELRYIRQGFVILMTISLVCFLIFLRRVLPKNLLSVYGRKLMAALGISEAFEKVYKKLREFFGLPERDRMRGGHDRKSFIMRNPLKRAHRSRADAEEKTKWKMLETNAARIRYIYTKYIRKSVKEGFHFDAVKTPDEISDTMDLSGEPKKLFSLYNGARYSDGSFPIADSEVESAVRLISKNGKTN